MADRLRRLLALLRPAPLAPFATPTLTSAAPAGAAPIAPHVARLRDVADEMATLGRSLYDQGAAETDPRLQDALCTTGKRLYETGCEVVAALTAPAQAPTSAALDAAHALLRTAHIEWRVFQPRGLTSDYVIVAYALEHAFRRGVHSGSAGEAAADALPVVGHAPPGWAALVGYADDLGRAIGAGRDPHAVRPPEFARSGPRR